MPGTISPTASPSGRSSSPRTPPGRPGCSTPPPRSRWPWARTGGSFTRRRWRDYTGADALTDRQVWAIARSLQLAQEYVESKGGSFLFTVAPNKLSLYPSVRARRGWSGGRSPPSPQVTEALGGERRPLQRPVQRLHPAGGGALPPVGLPLDLQGRGPGPRRAPL